MALLKRWLWQPLVWAGVILVLLGTLYLSAGRLLVPMLNAYRIEIQDWMSSQLGQPVHLGRLHAGWHGVSPWLYAEDVRLGAGSQPLSIARLHFRPDMLGSLWRGGWSLSAISLQGVDLELQQQQDGRWLLNGIATGGDTNAKPQEPAALLAQLERIGHLGLVDARIRIHPQGSAPLELREASLMLERAGRGHQIQARLLLPDGQPLALSLRLGGSLAQWQQASMQGYLSLPDSNWLHWLPAAWRAELAPDLQLDSVRLPVQLWLTASHGRLKRLQLETTGGLLHGQWQQQPVQLELGHIQADYHEDQRQRRLWLPQFNVRLQPQGSMQNLALQLRQAADTPAASTAVELAFQQLQLEPLLAAVLQHVPMPELAQDILRQLDFRGQLVNTRLRWHPGLPWQQQLEYDTNIRALDYSPWKNVPGATGIHGRLFGSLAGGELHLDSSGFSLYLRELFAEPWQYHKARARLTWALNEQLDFELTSPYLQVQGDEGELAGDFVIAIPQTPGLESYMDLRVGLRNGQASYKDKYLPLVLRDKQKELWDWLHAAIRGGDIHQGYFQYQGSLASGVPPEARSVSLFFDVDNAELAWQPGWPSLHEGRTRVYVDNRGIEVEIDRARILDTAVGQSHAQVSYPTSGPAQLRVETQLDSTLADALYMVQKTPLATSLPRLADWQGQGRLLGHLQLDIPLAADQLAHVVLDLVLDDNRLQMPEYGLAFEKLKGTLRIDSQRGLFGDALSGRFLGQPFTASVAPQKGAKAWSAQLRGKGRMQAERLQQWLELSASPLNGSFDYQLDLQVWEQGGQLQVDSNLQGVRIDLPAPLGKAATEQVPTLWHMTLDDTGQHYRLQHGQRLNALLALGQGKDAALRGELVLDGRAARVPASPGLRIKGRLAQLSVPDWLAALERYLPPSQAQTQSTPLVQDVLLETAELLGYGIPLQQARLDIVPAGTGWRVQLASQQAEGVIRVPATGPLEIALERLQLPAAAGETGLAADSLQPSDIPAMQVNIAQLLLGDELLGPLAFISQPAAQTVLFDDIRGGFKGANLKGALRWTGGAKPASSFQGELAGEHLERVLQAWGHEPFIRGEQFYLGLVLDWPGTPLDFSLASLSGKAGVKLRKGQLQALDGGAQALRVFGLLNFESIGRRLRLDFSDLWSKGLSYDRIDGLIDIERGHYRTLRPLTLEGVSSDLNLDGSLDVPSGVIDALLQVEMPISRNLPLAAIAVGAPAVGGALFVIDRLTGDRFARMAAVRYRITGDWDNPDITLTRGK